MCGSSGGLRRPGPALYHAVHPRAPDPEENPEVHPMDPIYSGFLHERYLPCGKSNCRCKNPPNPQWHGPYYLWVRPFDGKQVNRTLKPGTDLEKARIGIAGYPLLQRYSDQVLLEGEERVLEPDRAWMGAAENYFQLSNCDSLSLPSF